MRARLILAAVDGPNAEEQLYLKSVPETQQIVLLHLSDEFLRTTDPSTYGPSVHHAFRQVKPALQHLNLVKASCTTSIRIRYRMMLLFNVAEVMRSPPVQYYHKGLGDKAITYLGDATIKHPPAVAWMPLGLARLRPLPTAFSLGLPDRTHLWSWMGSTEGKPERAEMLEALDAHSRAADIQAMGFLRHFRVICRRVGRRGCSTGGPDAMGAMEYTLLMHQTQFVPIPAGNSPEQFRLWEAFEAGEGCGQHLPCMSCCTAVVMAAHHWLQLQSLEPTLPWAACGSLPRLA